MKNPQLMLIALLATLLMLVLLAEHNSGIMPGDTAAQFSSRAVGEDEPGLHRRRMFSAAPQRPETENGIVDLNGSER